ncbi:uncharacterized protein LOC126156227 [Schistocerca cancellata]|uniref:uncharacterized protein LOC126156227 n=1 Tax=Schistocerca cancellata TaxID=274614 RepID=UPI002119598B|nr:uncharacterized protein LOC126156227 [Schistocerca cancellata]
MEDLSEAGFTLAKAGHQLDYQHCLTALRAYARLHAASAKVLEDHPHYKVVYDPSKSADERQMHLLKEMCDKVFGAVANALKRCPGHEEYAEKFTRISDKVVEGTNKFWTSKDVLLPVILHVNCWKNNFMFKYVDGAVGDFSKVRSPAADVQCFLNADASEQLHRQHFDSLVVEYHDALRRTLRALGMHQQANAYPLQQLKADMDRAAVLGLFNCALRGLHPGHGEPLRPSRPGLQEIRRVQCGASNHLQQS